MYNIRVYRKKQKKKMEKRKSIKFHRAEILTWSNFYIRLRKYISRLTFTVSEFTLSIILNNALILDRNEIY